jgi:HD-GYP domain-containing protein (c-di-GMP phosphodiesterase class II)
LHDIGKLALMEEILDRPDGPTEEEVLLIRKHPLRGQAMLERAGEQFHRIGGIVRSCQEHWDGSGYPDGLARDEIPLASRVIFCCVAYESMTSERAYRKPMSHASAIREVWASSGSQFDPAVVPALVRAAARRASTAVEEAVPDARAHADDFAKAGAGGTGGDSG